MRLHYITISMRAIERAQEKPKLYLAGHRVVAVRKEPPHVAR